MNKIILTLILLFQALVSFATSWLGDNIYIDGKEYELCDYPLCLDSLLNQRILDILPEGAGTYLSWQGYVTTWEVHDNVLYLRHIKAEMGTSKEGFVLSNDTLRKIFPEYVNHYGIEAKWFNKKTRAIRGKLLRYTSALGFDKNCSEECLLTFENGKLTDKQFFQNKIICKNDFSSLKKAIYDKCPFVLENSKTYDNRKHRIEIFGATLSDDGKKIEDFHCTYTIGGKSYNKKRNKYIKELKKVIKEHFKMNCYHINGECFYEYDGPYTILL